MIKQERYHNYILRRIKEDDDATDTGQERSRSTGDSGFSRRVLNDPLASRKDESRSN